MSRNLDRRSFLRSLPALALAPGLLARSGGRFRVPGLARPAPLTGVALNHVEMAVSDPDRSRSFYQGLFGLPIQAREGSTTVYRVGGGPQFMSIRPVAAGEEPSLARLGVSVQGFDLQGTTKALESAGVRSAGSDAPKDAAMRWWTVDRPAPGGGTVRELLVGDPNGLVFQVVDPSYCGGGGALGNVCSSVEPSPVQGVFDLRDLSHFTCRVGDASKSVDFFENVMGLPVQVYQATTPALGLGGGPQFLMFIGGGRPNRSGPPPAAAIDHVCFSMEEFESEEVMSKLAAYGIREQAKGEPRNTPLRSWVSLRMPNRGGAPGGTAELYFTDPDGLIVQLQDTTYCGGGGPLGSICKGA